MSDLPIAGAAPVLVLARTGPGWTDMAIRPGGTGAWMPLEIEVDLDGFGWWLAQEIRHAGDLLLANGRDRAEFAVEDDDGRRLTVTIEAGVRDDGTKGWAATAHHADHTNDRDRHR